MSGAGWRCLAKVLQLTLQGSQGALVSVFRAMCRSFHDFLPGLEARLGPLQGLEFGHRGFGLSTVRGIPLQASPGVALCPSQDPSSLQTTQTSRNLEV